MNSHSLPLRQALEALWRVMGDDYGLLTQLPFDALMVRMSAGEADLFRGVPRLLTLLVSDSLTVEEGIEAMDLLRTRVRADERWSYVLDALDAWWFEALQSDPFATDPATGGVDVNLPGDVGSGVSPSMVLGFVSRSGEPMVRWLHVWLTELDGVPAVHLADAVIDGLSDPSWEGQEDQRAQVLGWAKSEAVVNGLALVAAPHLDSDRLSRVLDRILPD